MTVIDHNSFVRRKCPICDSNASEKIETMEAIIIGVKYKHRLYANLVVCRQCGLIYNNPTIEQSEYNKYYNDLLSVYEPESSYSIDNRIHLIKKYSVGRKKIVEIGGNEQGKFKDELEKIFDEYVSYDVGKQYGNTVTELEDIGKVDIIVAYYVLEHVLDLEEFLSIVHRRLNEGGVAIFEVSDANNYYRDDTGLLALEHISHFTPTTIDKLMKRYGFDLLEMTKIYASRDEGFVGVFRKSSKMAGNVSFDKSDYILGKSVIEDGMRRFHSNKKNLEIMCKKLKRLDGGELHFGVPMLYLEAS